MMGTAHNDADQRHDVLGVVIVGYDGAGTQNHQLDMYEPGFTQHPGFAIRAITDHPAVSDDRRAISRDAARRLGVPYIDDLDAALSRDDIDLASVCVLFDHRVDAVERAANHGVHVLVDKPMALTIEDADRMADTATAAGIHLVPANHVRHLPALRALKEVIASGRFGTLTSIHADFVVTTGATKDSAGDPRPWPLGELMNFLAYPVDAIRSITSREVTTVHATRGGFFYGGDDDEDCGVVSLRLEGAVTATLVVCRAPMTGHLTAGLHRYRVMGTDGMALLDTRRPFGLIQSAAAPARVSVPAVGDSVGMMLTDLASALREGRAPTLGPIDARRALEVTLAARQSADERTTVDLTTHG